MEKLVYVTGNKGKILGAQDQFKECDLELDWYEYDCFEPDINDIEYISRYKVMEAYEIIKKPCFVVDSGFYIEEYPDNPGFPGAFPKRAINNAKGGLDALLEKMSGVENRTCRFVDCLSYYDGTNLHRFYGICEGNLAYEKRGTHQAKAKSGLWYIFIPNNCSKTLAEMNDDERKNRNDGRTSAIPEFIKWYKREVLGREFIKKLDK